MEDVERQRAAALLEAERRLHTIIEHAPIVLFAIDRQGVLTVAEGAAMERLGVNQVEAVGHSLFEIYPPDHAILKNFARALQGECFVAEVRAQGRVWETRYSPLTDEGEIKGVIGVATDVTDRKRAEAERDWLLTVEKAARAAAEEALRAREEFLCIASHELNSPLTVLKLQLQDALRQPETTAAPRLARLLDRANRQVDRLARQVNDLLDATRIGTGQLTLKREPTDLAELAAEVVARENEAFTRAGCAPTLIAPAPVVGSWDHMRLEQVLENLLSNSRKYGPGAPIEVLVESSGTVARLAVRDYGPGIAAADQLRIFERFERAVPLREYGGLGLGLYIARQIAAAHGGTIGVQSTPGQGALFTLTLPI